MYSALYRSLDIANQMSVSEEARSSSTNNQVRVNILLYYLNVEIWNLISHSIYITNNYSYSRT